MTGLLLTAFVFTVSAVTVNLTGIISSPDGKAISGAIVELSGQKIKDTTDATGSYSIKSTEVAISHAIQLPAFRSVNLTKGILSLSLNGSSSVKVELFDVHGKLISRESSNMAAAGNYQLNFSNRNYTSATIIIRVSIDNTITSFQYFPIGNSSRQLDLSSHNESERPVLSKAVAVLDTLKVSAAGYLPSTKPVTSFDGTVNVTMEVSNLQKFSFFVTSQKALESLSGSVNGFGGDFRFGKTGQGAGLLGADSICQCIAEKSMPGSKVKQWRAFLSAVKGPDGKQVDAISRIGSGPWYDRKGRLLANNTSELLNNRPLNADIAIKNDLPNEDGIPNHYPDPNNTSTAVDNHHMVTGSTANGTLYSQSTCDDWTNVNASGQPRCGFSWPRSGNAGNWISGFDAGGCKAGVWVNSSGMGTTGTIGYGGGYGGFYCFALVP
jgi:hypothetical protein